MRESTKQLVIEKAFQLEIEEMLKHEAENPHERDIFVDWEPGATFCYLYEMAEAMEHSVDLFEDTRVKFWKNRVSAGDDEFAAFLAHEVLNR